MGKAGPALIESRLPIVRPSKIICAGVNYRDHADETGIEVPRQPILFAKWPNSLIGPGDPIVLPPFTNEVDYEAELAVIIGRQVRDVSTENALEAVSARQFIRADGLAPFSRSFTQEIAGSNPVGGTEKLPASDTSGRCSVKATTAVLDTASGPFPLTLAATPASLSLMARCGPRRC